MKCLLLYRKTTPVNFSPIGERHYTSLGKGVDSRKLAQVQTLHQKNIFFFMGFFKRSWISSQMKAHEFPYKKSYPVFDLVRLAKKKSNHWYVCEKHAYLEAKFQLNPCIFTVLIAGSHKLTEVQTATQFFFSSSTFLD